MQDDLEDYDFENSEEEKSAIEDGDEDKSGKSAGSQTKIVLEG
jgi:hypothetical protein